MERIVRISMTVLLLLGMFPVGRVSAQLVSNLQTKNQWVVVIDAGHGGVDPGKVGIHQEQEKEINLQIARYLREELEKENIKVVMTRETDEDLADADASNKKLQSLQRRCELIEQVQPDCVVSIHQNSFSDSTVSGAQVFYYTESEEGKKLAELIQQCLIEQVDSENHRMAKGNNTYYLLRKTAYPTVIAECGFLSNPQEAVLLADEDYQKRVAKGICTGIMKFLEKDEK